MHKNAEILKAIADGLPLDKVQVKDPFSHLGDVWVDICKHTISVGEHYCSCLLDKNTQIEFRINPEPKPDVVSDFQNYIYSPPLGYSVRCNVSYTFDGETGEVKNIELIKK